MKCNVHQAIAIVAVLLIGGSAVAQKTFAHRWDIGVPMAVGSMNQDLFMMNFELDFSHRISDTKWRWGVAAGLMNPGPLDLEVDESQDVFLYPNFLYIRGYADYAFLTAGKTAFFLHGAVAPCWQKDVWVYHTQDKPSALFQYGIGMDAGGYFRMSLLGFATIYGDAGVLFSYGFYFGKK